MPQIQIQNLSFKYPDGVHALKGIELEIPEGEITALVGHNGAGKSTLMTCISTLHTEYEGSILWDGQNVLKAPFAYRKRIGLLRDFFSLYQGLSVVDDLHYFAAHRGVAESTIVNKVQEVIELCGLEELQHRKLNQLSRGQKQKVAIAQALVHEPELLLLDEPASGLDPVARHELGLLLVKLKERGFTLIVSSHILSELDEYATFLIGLKDGKVVQSVPLQAQKQSKIWMQVRLLNPDYRFIPLVEGSNLAHNVKLKEDRLLVEVDNEESTKAALLQLLHKHDAQVSYFATLDPKIKDLYLEAL